MAKFFSKIQVWYSISDGMNVIIHFRKLQEKNKWGDFSRAEKAFDQEAIYF